MPARRSRIAAMSVALLATISTVIVAVATPVTAVTTPAPSTTAAPGAAPPTTPAPSTTPAVTPTSTLPSSTPSSTSVPGAVRGVTATTIRVGGLGDTTRYGGADIGARARFERANRSGGINGRTIEYLGMRDDAGGPGSTTSATALVDVDRVFAVAPVVTPDLVAAPDLANGHVPYFGWAVSSNFCGNDWGFSFTGCSIPPGGATTSDAPGRLLAAQLAAAGTGKRVAIVTELTDAGAYFVRTTAAAMKAAGLEVVSANADLPVPAAADYAAVARALLAANGGPPPDAVVVVASLANVLQLQTALRAEDFHGVFADTIGYAPELVAASTDSYVFTPTAAVETAPDNPAMAQLVADVRAVAPRAAIDQAVVAGYWSADLFVTAAERAGRKLTPESLERRANRKFTYQVASTVGPVTFPAAHDAPAPCGSLVRSTGTAYVVAQPYQCGTVVPVGG